MSSIATRGLRSWSLDPRGFKMIWEHAGGNKVPHGMFYSVYKGTQGVLKPRLGM